MMIATVGTGALMFAVHIFAPAMGEKEYGLFATLLGMVNMMMIPVLGLQTIFAQQTAEARTPDHERKLQGTVQRLLLWNFLLWAVLALAVALAQNQFLHGLSIGNRDVTGKFVPRPAALWLTMAIGLAQLWLPVLGGILQGKQNFFWLGWSMISNGLGRFISVGLIVTILAWGGTGGILGALIGFLISMLIAGWHTRQVWSSTPPRFSFEWRPWLCRVIPLTLGLGASQFMFSADFLFVRTIFAENQTGYYAASGMIGRGLVMFTAPLTVVMFPKIVQNRAQNKKSNILGYTLLATGILAGLAALSCTLGCALLRHWAVQPESIPPLLQNLLAAKLKFHQEGILIITQLIPWFVWCMLPLTLANVLLNNLMARENYRIVPYLVLLVCAYSAAIVHFSTSFVSVIQVLGIFNLIFFALTGLFTRWRKQDSPLSPNKATAA